MYHADRQRVFDVKAPASLARAPSSSRCASFTEPATRTTIDAVSSSSSIRISSWLWTPWFAPWTLCASPTETQPTRSTSQIHTQSSYTSRLHRLFVSLSWPWMPLNGYGPKVRYFKSSYSENLHYKRLITIITVGLPETFNENDITASHYTSSYTQDRR